MKHFRPDLVLLVILVVTGCAQEPAQPTTEISTIDNTPTDLRPVAPPEMLTFDSSAVEKRDRRGEAEPDPYRFTQNLPFSPLIAMDPVTGEKMQILKETPVAEYKDRIYYFASDSNRRVFLANPEEYTKGAFARY